MSGRSSAAKRVRQKPSPSTSSKTKPSSNQPAVPGHHKPTRHQHSNQPAKPRDMTRLREEGREKVYRDSLCTMCIMCTSNHVSKHTHFYTADMRRFAAKNSPRLLFLCPFCKVLETSPDPHYANQGSGPHRQHPVWGVGPA